MSISYKKSGVDYNLLDPLKIFAQKQGLLTAKNLIDTPFAEIPESRGESAYIIETEDSYIACITEGLGTKNIVADEMRKVSGKTYYDAIAYDTVISIVMDISAVGARPLVVSSYWAIGDTEWLRDKKRLNDLIRGWKKACDDTGAVWGGGETPILKGIVDSHTIDLAGAAVGIIKPKRNLVLGKELSVGDRIIILESSGIHVNGLTLARMIARQLPYGYQEKLPNGKMFGEELLTPTKSYSKLIYAIQNAHIPIHYMANITGHGWRKIMRAKKNFSYMIDKLPDVPDIFTYLKEKSKLSNREMYATFNMGAGFAIFVRPIDTKKVLDIAEKFKVKAWISGRVEKGPKQVSIKPLNITYNEKDLSIR